MTDAIRPLIAGNWKMNGLKAQAAEFEVMLDGAAGVTGKADLLVCPPATLIAAFAEKARGKKVAVGAQDCHPKASGAHTGELHTNAGRAVCRTNFADSPEGKASNTQDDLYTGSNVQDGGSFNVAAAQAQVGDMPADHTACTGNVNLSAAFTVIARAEATVFRIIRQIFGVSFYWRAGRGVSSWFMGCVVSLRGTIPARFHCRFQT